MASGHNGLYFFKRLGTLATLVVFRASKIGLRYQEDVFSLQSDYKQFYNRMVLLLKKWDRERLSTIRKIGRAQPCVCPTTPLLTLE